MMNGLRFAVAAVAVAAMFSGSAQATLLWYDGFTTTDGGGDYVVATQDVNGVDLGPDLNGQSGGSGPPVDFFAGPWVAAGYPDTVTFQNTKVFATGLDRPGLTSPGIGGSAANTAHFGGCCWESRTSRLLTDPWTGFTNPDGTFYVSFLADFGAGDHRTPNHRMFEMHDGGFDDDLNRNLMLGLSHFALPEGPLRTQLVLSVEDANTTSATNEPLLVNGAPVNLNQVNIQGTHLMVLKFELSNSGNDVISAWIDPVGTIETAPNASVSVSEFLADRMSTIAQFAYDGISTSSIFDELRVGTEFADVAINTTPWVPEPASLSLVALGMIGALAAARKRRG